MSQYLVFYDPGKTGAVFLSHKTRHSKGDIAMALVQHSMGCELLKYFYPQEDAIPVMEFYYVASGIVNYN